jgi:hypothetical protein
MVVTAQSRRKPKEQRQKWPGRESAGTLFSSDK